MHVQFSGRYRLQVFHGDTDILLKDTGWFDNLITNNGLDLIATGFTANCFVGSDTADPSISDTSILNVLASSSNMAYGATAHNITTPPFYGARSFAFTFGIGAIQGTIGQVAIGGSSSNLFSKARLAGTNGTPTTLTLSGVDRLVLTYELRIYIRTTDISHTIDINGVTYNCVNRARGIDQAGFWQPLVGMALGTVNGSDPSYWGVCTGGTSPFVGSLTGRPSGTAVICSNYGSETYVSGNFYSDFWATWNTSTNLVNITAAYFGASYAGVYTMGGIWQSSIEGPQLNKTIYQNLRLEFRFSWDRYAL